MNINICKQKLNFLYQTYIKVLNSLSNVFLLAIRLYWGFQFFETGMGKLGNIGGVIDFFTSLNIPFPVFHAYLVGTVEMVGGLFLMLGLFSRLISLPLVIAMTVAYLTADLEAVQSLFSDPDLFVKATPFPFFLTSLIILLFGAGLFSLDKALCAYAHRKKVE